MYSNNNDQMVGENEIYQEVFKKMGVEVVDTETFADKDTDFSAQLTKSRHPIRMSSRLPVFTRKALSL